MQELEDTIIRAPSLAALANCRALVVGADPEPRRRLRLIAETRAFDTREAVSGGEAIARLHNEHCPVLIIDARLPDMSPAELCNEVRDSLRSRYIYTLLLCDPDDPNAIVTGLRAGADDCLSRTARAAELTARLEAARRIAALEQGLRQACETNARIATTDPLTGTFNRRYLDKELPRELERARRYVRPLSVLALDLDHFKGVNDRYGHATGDRVLKTVSRVLQKRLRRDVDWIARVGGEEFAIVLPETGLEGAQVVAERLRDAIRREHVAIDPEGIPDGALGPVAQLREPLSVTASIGVASVETLAEFGGLTAERLLARADAALYRSKRSGRNRVTMHVPARAVN
jgi:two-component system cell cycle response regulator